MKQFDESIKEFIGEYDEEMIYEYENDEPEHEVGNPQDGDDAHVEVDRVEGDHAEVDAPPDAGIEHDPTVGAEIILPRGDRSEMGRVVGRKRDCGRTFDRSKTSFSPARFPCLYCSME